MSTRLIPLVQLPSGSRTASTNSMPTSTPLPSPTEPATLRYISFVRCTARRISSSVRMVAEVPSSITCTTMGILWVVLLRVKRFVLLRARSSKAATFAA